MGHHCFYIGIDIVIFPEQIVFVIRVSVERSETPESMVTPVKDALLLKDSTVMDISSPDIDGIKHSIPVIIVKVNQTKIINLTDIQTI